MKLSAFGRKFTADAGITSLMDDLGNALASGDDMIMMGGGNPGQVPAIQERLTEVLGDITRDPEAMKRLVGIYDPPQGEKRFIASLAELLNREYGWGLTEDNIALTNGSQAAFFMLFNMFAGDFDDGSQKHILLPLAPEYIGYADAGIAPELFRAVQPEITFTGAHEFKYRVDFDAVDVTSDTGAICVSRPTNPTGNVVTDQEMERLESLARHHDVPLIVDGAYGTPFPSLLYVDAQPRWNEQIVLCLSLSKLGMPAARTGIVIAAPEIIRALSSINAIMNLATGSFGAMLAEPLVRSGEILSLSREVVCPFYHRKMENAVKVFTDAMGEGCRWYVHKPEGAMFLWFWFPDLPVSSLELYQRLKARGVLVVSGHYFFPGLAEDGWRHRHECIRVTYSQDDERVAEGLRRIASEVQAIWAEQG
ncbi:valine-pyruvate aminotransferase apoenzyme [Marinobacter segnicrescens]|uniref:Valine-pyruvate aminotransferase apoenzyme n=1 Tax=Marinobacter segnicrescens TaxID=430453 RepID=A0A1H9YNU1_9GAMM|nr:MULTISPECIES: valine--pyruvate transaminase [Marinobacter]UZD64344.1 valine--pyruvate transaminase [Marinobacter sp. AN1]SES70709.1 valine-pyruvate aminotransferase apoenzyme [Marinobacter segnicrescens]